MNVENGANSGIYGNDVYLTANATWHELDGRWKAEKVHALMVQLGCKPLSICDIGCGTGAVLDHLGGLLDVKPTLTGFEVSSYTADLASAQHPQVRVLLQSASEYHDERFDLALLLDVIEHVDDYIGFMRSVKSLADMFIFHIPLDMAVQTVARVSPIIRSRHTIGHLHYFSRETALATIEYAGYEIVAESFTTGSPDTHGSTSRKYAVDRVRALARRLLGDSLAARILGGFSLLVAARPVGTS